MTLSAISIGALQQKPDVLIALDTEFLAMHNQLEAVSKADWLWQQNRVRHIHIKDYDDNASSTDNCSPLLASWRG